MSYQVTLNSRNVLVPVTLEGHDGRRLDTPPSRLDMATAMVISVSSSGGFSQDYIPLRISVDAPQAYAGREWELRAQAAGRDHYVFYLGIPDACFAASAAQPHPKSLSAQVIGSSGLSGRDDFSGGVDVSLQAEVALPLVPGFLGLVDRFFPPLLPHAFVASYRVARVEAAGRRDLVLMASLQPDPSERPPVSFGKHWDPKNWIGAAVENLDPAGGGAYHVIRGGCFYARNKRVTHWFGSGIGLDDRGFRQEAAERIRALGASGNGAWVFWLEPQGRASRPSDLEGLERSRPQARFTIRHPLLHRLLARAPRAGAPSGQAAIARLPAESAVLALSQAARIVIGHPEELHRARTEPAHALWSEETLKTAAVRVADALAAAEAGGPPAGAAAAPASPPSLEAAVRGLYDSQGEALRSLESAFDESGAFAAWDSPGHPLRDLIAAYLEEGAEARSPA